MVQNERQPRSDNSLYTSVDDELYDELEELAGQKIVYHTVWEESLADALQEPNAAPETQRAFDIDLYLRDGVYFELYGALCYLSLDGDPLQDAETVDRQLAALIDQELWLEEIAVDDEDSLVLLLGRHHKPLLYISVGAWVLEEWDELPDE
jgi:hypothetical protein